MLLAVQIGGSVEGGVLETGEHEARVRKAFRRPGWKLRPKLHEQYAPTPEAHKPDQQCGSASVAGLP